MMCGMMATSISAVPAQRAGNGALRSLFIPGPVGRLEALLNEGDPQAPFAALICHPHPTGGGTMHNKVVYHAMKALNAPEFGLEWPVLRFNFRGTGLSEGQHDGIAEVEDVHAALEWLESKYQKPIVAIGFSFGAAMTLAACCGLRKRSTVKAVIALGLPTQVESRAYHYSFLSHCSLPKLFLSGDRDQFASTADLQQVAATTAEPKKLVLLPGADHFFNGQLEAMQNELARWLMELRTCLL
jgi:alpha/beta superfamily hydrolase